MARDASLDGLGRPGHQYFVESSPGGCHVHVESRTTAPQSPLGGENLETPPQGAVCSVQGPPESSPRVSCVCSRAWGTSMSPKGSRAGPWAEGAAVTGPGWARWP